MFSRTLRVTVCVGAERMCPRLPRITSVLGTLAEAHQLCTSARLSQEIARTSLADEQNQLANVTLMRPSSSFHKVLLRRSSTLPDRIDPPPHFRIPLLQQLALAIIRHTSRTMIHINTDRSNTTTTSAAEGRACHCGLNRRHLPSWLHPKSYPLHGV